jgi:8-oxo-dGTP pyrophosphatase MutT (NUDIX family)
LHRAIPPQKLTLLKPQGLQFFGLNRTPAPEQLKRKFQEQEEDSVARYFKAKAAAESITPEYKRMLEQCSGGHLSSMGSLSLSSFLPHRPDNIWTNPEAKRSISASFSRREREANEGNVASGILAIARDTKRLCLAWRSAGVIEGDCWGTIGGAVKHGFSPADSAKVEMREEVGYDGDLELHAGHIFKAGKFRYHNFVGIVDSEFELNPAPCHAWETDAIEWRTLEDIEKDIEENPGDYHPGLIRFLKKSRGLIHRQM